jgi:hypothetical protein
MWPGLWVVSVVPILAFITALDAYARLSKLLARTFHIKKPEVVLLVLLVGVLYTLVTVLNLKLEDVYAFNLRLVQYRSVEVAEVWFERHAMETRILGLDALMIVVAVPIVVRMAFNRRRPVLLWLPLALLGNVGSIVWLAVNGRTKSGAAVPFSPSTPDVHSRV